VAVVRPQPIGPSAVTATLVSTVPDTVALAVAVQPLALVNVTEYVLATLTEITDVLAPVDHKTVPAPMADRLTVGEAQLSVLLLGVMLTEVATVLLTTVADCAITAVHPLVLVASTVYVPDSDCGPNERAEPVPTTALPVVAPSRRSW
jgi:hypothetical protein